MKEIDWSALTNLLNGILDTGKSNPFLITYIIVLFMLLLFLIVKVKKFHTLSQKRLNSKNKHSSDFIKKAHLEINTLYLAILSIQSSIIPLGVLFTFLGIIDLLFAFSKIDLNQENMSSIRELLDSLFIVFSSSVISILTSTFINIFFIPKIKSEHKSMNGSEEQSSPIVSVLSDISFGIKSILVSLNSDAIDHKKVDLEVKNFKDIALGRLGNKKLIDLNIASENDQELLFKLNEALSLFLNSELLLELRNLNDLLDKNSENSSILFLVEAIKSLESYRLTPDRKEYFDQMTKVINSISHLNTDPLEEIGMTLEKYKKTLENFSSNIDQNSNNISEVLMSLEKEMKKFNSAADSALESFISNILHHFSESSDKYTVQLKERVKEKEQDGFIVR